MFCGFVRYVYFNELTPLVSEASLALCASETRARPPAVCGGRVHAWRWVVSVGNRCWRSLCPERGGDWGKRQMGVEELPALSWVGIACKRKAKREKKNS